MSGEIETRSRVTFLGELAVSKLITRMRKIGTSLLQIVTHAVIGYS